jgi:hypothetical protein
MNRERKDTFTGLSILTTIFHVYVVVSVSYYPLSFF